MATPSTSRPTEKKRSPSHALSPYDLLLLDVVLPALDGFGVGRQLRTEGCVVPVLMLTARDAVDDRVGGSNLIYE
jgi:DNA-binding response OmpR family regulator